MSSNRGGRGGARGGGPQGSSHHFQPYPRLAELSVRGRGGGEGPPRGHGGRDRGGGGGGPGGGGRPPPPPDLAPGERRPLVVRTNVFAIRRFPSARFYQYTISISPEPRTRGMKRVIIDKLEATNATVAYRSGIYDGENLFYSQHAQLASQYVVDLDSRQQDKPRPRFHVTLTRTTSDVIEPLRQSDISGNMTVSQVAINLLQLLSQEAARRKSAYWNAKRSTFFEGLKTAHLGGVVMLWHGFLQSVKAVQGNIVINVDAASTLMWAPDHLLDAVTKLLQDAGFSDPNLRQFDENHAGWWIIRSMLKNLRVAYTSTGGVVKQRRIYDILPRACTFVFTPKKGPQMTVGTYWQSIIGRPLDPKLMGVYLDEKKRVVVPAELCDITPGQRYIRPLNKEQQIKALGQMTQRPSDRWANIAQGMQFFDHRNSPYMIQANMDVSDRYIMANGLQIGPPRVSYAAGPPQRGVLPELNVDVSRGGWSMPQGGKFYNPKAISHWDAYNITHNGNVTKMTNFLEVFRKCCAESGMGVPNTPIALSIMAGEFQAHMVARNGGPPPDFDGSYKPLFIFFLSTAGASGIRKTIKYWAEVHKGVTTQCIMIDKLSATPLFGNNIAMKVNAKLGGINCIARTPHLAAFTGNTLIIGADVTHPSPGILNRPSFPAVVGSLDDTFTQYASCMDVQAPRMDMIENLCVMVRHLMFQWVTSHKGRLPAHVVYFRDGISEGEYNNTGGYEREQIEKAWGLVIQDIIDMCIRDPRLQNDTPNPTGAKLNLTFIVVEKRHRIRYAPDGPLSKQNVPAGTVVTEATAARGYENFYIVSQAGLLGTSRPAHCVLLQRDPDLTFEMCQDLVYFLSHVCARTTKSVSLPAPIYYADLLAAEALNYIAPGHAIFEGDNVTVASGEQVMFDLDGWRHAMAEGKGRRRVVNNVPKVDPPHIPGPDFVNPRLHNRLFFL